MYKIFRTDKPWWIFIKAVVMIIVPLGVLALFHETLVIGVSMILSLLSQAIWLRAVLEIVPFSPARSWLMVSTISEIHPDGLAIAGSLGNLLHQILPAVFVKSELTAPWAWMSAVLEPQSSPLARLVTWALVEVVMINVGSILVYRGLRSTNPLPFVGWGIFVQIQALAAIFGFPLSLEILEDMGIGFIVGPLTEGFSKQYQYFMGTLIPISIRIFLVLLGFVPMKLTQTMPTIRRKIPLLALVGAFVWVFILPIPPYLGIVPPDGKAGTLLVTETPVPVITDLSQSRAPEVTAKISPPVISDLPLPAKVVPEVVRTEPRASQTVKIDLDKSTGQFQLLVNGTPSTIRGVHYYFGDLVKKPLDVREKVLRQDLSIIKEVGFTTVAGWEEAGFDEQFLELASEYGLTVVKPIALEPENVSAGSNTLAKGDFLDRSFRDKIKERITQIIKKSKNDPALLMWNVGADEPIEKVRHIYRRSEEQVQAAADLIVELAALAYENDPAHPTIVSEPQDMYAGFYDISLGKLRRAGKDPSRFFIMGGNFYHPTNAKGDLQRSKATISGRLGVSFAVTEWAPFGIDKKDRPLFRARMAKEVAEATPISFAYVYNPAADPINGVLDPTVAIVTGLSLTDLDRTDNNGLLTALASTLGRPLFPTALAILKADRERGWSGVPLSHPIPRDWGIEQYFAGAGPDGRMVAYRWLITEKNSLIGPTIVKEALVDNGSRIVHMTGPFLDFYLSRGGLAIFGLPIGDVYENIVNGQPVFEQDFANGWALIQKK